MSQNSGNINVANAASTLPMTVGSYLPLSGGPGIGGLILGIAGTYVGQIGVAVSMDGINFKRVLDSSITNQNDGSTGIAANATGIYTCPIGALQVFVYFVEYTSGAATITASTGNGSGIPGETGGGSTVNATVVANALGSPLSNQAIIASTGTPVRGPNLAAKNGVIITASPNNTDYSATQGGVAGTHGSVPNCNIDGTGAGAFILPGASVAFACDNAQDLDVNGFLGDVFSFAVS